MKRMAKRGNWLTLKGQGGQLGGQLRRHGQPSLQYIFLDLQKELIPEKNKKKQKQGEIRKKETHEIESEVMKTL